jgi:hypothetical protein
MACQMIAKLHDEIVENRVPFKKVVFHGLLMDFFSFSAAGLWQNESKQWTNVENS